jgi:putative ABC transport system permease protein
VVPERCTQDAIARTQVVCAIDPALLPRVFALEEVQGRLVDLAPGQIAVQRGDAAGHGWTIGSKVPVHLPGGTRELTVSAIYDSYYLFGAALMVPADYASLGGDQAAGSVYVRTADGVTVQAARTAIESAVSSGAAVQIIDRDARRQRDLDQIDGSTWVYRALTGLAALMGLAGIINVLGLSIVERSRELGVLRAVGMDRRQVRSMVRAEAVISAIVGTLAGIVLGTWFGWAAVKVLENSSVPIRFTVPIGTLALIAGLVTLVGVAAATVPARLASRVDVLRAVTSE